MRVSQVQGPLEAGFHGAKRVLTGWTQGEDVHGLAGAVHGSMCLDLPCATCRRNNEDDKSEPSRFHPQSATRNVTWRLDHGAAKEPIPDGAEGERNRTEDEEQQRYWLRKQR